MTSWLETIGVGLLIVFIAGVVMSQVTFRVMNR